ncbi:hypothetical protein L1085_000440 [Streptomyces sp. MSC1_001]|uniref:hypothetical protein n=1 Tax=Streptomyces sp. MSC1_001 TaxID=2909263 RepID=UPI00202F5941|nr:hypothetical protein [Streptomyces sp. MSC1_001]
MTRLAIHDGPMTSPGGVPPFKVREAIAEALWDNVKAQDLAEVCEYLGLAQQEPGEDPYCSKRSYVKARLQDMDLPALVTVARRVVAEYGDEDLKRILAPLGLHGVSTDMKNLIFAADGPKPRIVLPDSIGNAIRIVENEQYCLVYDRPLGEHGVSWADLADWWASRRSEAPSTPDQSRRELHGRLRRSLSGNGAEELVFDAYVKLGFDVPALIPQVYLHYDPYTVTERQGHPVLTRHRMDFLLLMNHRARAVIEVDGIQHYSRDNPQKGAPALADSVRYAAMMAEDRRLTLQGYEVYRVGGQELADRASAEKGITEFFTALLRRHGHLEPER